MMSADRDLTRAVLNGDVERARQAFGRGADANTRLAGQSTLLHHAAGADQAAMVQLLLERGAHTDSTDSTMATPLHWAAAAGQSDTTQLLLKDGADANARTTSQNTPLHRAARQGRTEVARLLIAAGANPKVTNSSGQTPGDLAMHPDIDAPVRQDMLDLLESAAGAKPTAPRTRPKRGKTRRR